MHTCSCQLMTLLMFFSGWSWFRIEIWRSMLRPGNVLIRILYHSAIFVKEFVDFKILFLTTGAEKWIDTISIATQISFKFFKINTWPHCLTFSSMCKYMYIFLQEIQQYSSALIHRSIREEFLKYLFIGKCFFFLHCLLDCAYKRQNWRTNSI